MVFGWYPGLSMIGGGAGDDDKHAEALSFF